MIAVAFFVRPDVWENLILLPLGGKKFLEVFVIGNASSA
jgi:hypothetical protein